jgi:NAD(P)-dependent dehydrogenase (short-subunit alcohol dehydrogenase family)
MPDRPLDGRVAVITGASRGLGRAMALSLAGDGASLALVGRDRGQLDETARAVRACRAPAETFAADVAVEADVTALGEAVMKRFGRVDILVNNAGGGLHTPHQIEQVEEEHWDRVVDVNLKGAFLCCRAVLAQMRRQGPGGKIVNLSALAGRSYATLGGAQYASAKAGLGGLTRQLAHEVGPDGINVNAVAPTVMLTGDRVKSLWESKTEEERRRVLESIPLRRLADPKEIARVVVFLASDDASYVTGVTLDVNGGRFMS